MYSLVLMSALVSGPETPQFNGYFRDLFSFRGSCNGCYGSCDGRTSGGYSNSCNGGSGCCGGSSCDGFGSRIRSFFSFGGGGCCGGSCNGTRSASAGNSCNGGSCYGSQAKLSQGCYGSSCYGSSCFGSGCFGSGVIYDSGPALGMGTPIYPGTIYPGTTTNPDYTDPRAPIRPAVPEIDESRKTPVLPAPGNLVNDPTRATVTVRAPADAKVFAEGTPLKMNDGERTFVTPQLPTGQTFDYHFRVEYTREGEKLSREKKVTVRAGGLSLCDFTESTSKLPAPPSPIPAEVKEHIGKMIPSAEPMSAKMPGLFPISTAVSKEKAVNTERPTMLPATKPTGTSERAKFSIKLPDNAVLYIDGKKNEKVGSLREFVTPPLPQGQEFKYELKVEIPGPNGYPQSAATTVSFRAGDTVPTLDFVELLKQ